MSRFFHAIMIGGDKKFQDSISYNILKEKVRYESGQTLPFREDREKRGREGLRARVEDYHGLSERHCLSGSPITMV